MTGTRSTPRLVATDLDGTLVRDDGSVSPLTRQVLTALVSRGVPVVIATARPLRWLEDIWPLVGAGAMGVVSNGAIWWDTGQPAGQRLRHLHGIGRGEGLDLCARIAGRLPQAAFAIETAEGLRLGPGFVDPYAHPADTPRGELPRIWDLPAVKLMVRHTQPEAADWPTWRHEVVSAVGPDAEATWSGTGLVEISGRGVTKAAALARLCDELTVDAQEVVAFGDMPNDLPMLTWAGTSYAMANADPAVVAVAGGLAPSNTDDGVARTLIDLFDLSASLGTDLSASLRDSDHPRE